MILMNQANEVDFHAYYASEAKKDSWKGSED